MNGRPAPIRSSTLVDVVSGGAKGETKAENAEDAAEAADRCGRSSARGLFQGVILERESGDLEGVYYGAILGRVRYNPSVGVSFIFEDAEGLWKVTIAGRNLHDMHRELTLGRRESIRLGDNVTEIDIKAWSPQPKK